MARVTVSQKIADSISVNPALFRRGTRMTYKQFRNIAKSVFPAIAKANPAHTEDFQLYRYVYTAYNNVFKQYGRHLKCQKNATFFYNLTKAEMEKRIAYLQNHGKNKIQMEETTRNGLRQRGNIGASTLSTTLQRSADHSVVDTVKVTYKANNRKHTIETYGDICSSYDTTLKSY